MKDTMGENAAVSSSLVFGFLPRCSTLENNLPEQKERMQAKIFL